MLIVKTFPSVKRGIFRELSHSCERGPGIRHPYVLGPVDYFERLEEGSRVFVHEASSTPWQLLDALDTSKMTLVGTPFDFHRGPPNRKAKTWSGRVQLPIHYHSKGQELPYESFQIECAVLKVSRPNRHGFSSVGPSTAFSLWASKARFVVAEISDQVPMVNGNSFIDMDHFDATVITNAPLTERPPLKPHPVGLIPDIIASLVSDGSCLQVGSDVPDEYIGGLIHCTGLGIHSDCLTPALFHLYEIGNVSGEHKTIRPGQITAAYAVGDQDMYRRLDGNCDFWFDSAQEVCDPLKIAMNEKAVAINMGSSIDLTGQITCENSRAVDNFTIGARISNEGKAIIVLSSLQENGESSILPVHPRGTRITVSRWEAPIVVTEYGYVDLWGLSTRQRAEKLIEIAHPKFREELSRKAAELFGKEK